METVSYIASVIWLATAKKIEKKDRPVGVVVKAKTTKSKKKKNKGRKKNVQQKRRKSRLSLTSPKKKSGLSQQQLQV